eukprot:CAMPEP_0184499832 /NCGR_PEP_ID=MMETSP0113_2-20130426/42676_1 /TAXON_ID=91329 /ORGANISM="Norrisiella sphaerica, Strain BC52" /LENGTH=253 /DNA_ID=CAMNT_0026887903 /DNA_START=53 /DNA_END=814 /DNA_ORIENTATION=+
MPNYILLLSLAALALGTPAITFSRSTTSHNSMCPRATRRRGITWPVHRHVGVQGRIEDSTNEMDNSGNMVPRRRMIQNAGIGALVPVVRLLTERQSVRADTIEGGENIDVEDDETGDVAATPDKFTVEQIISTIKDDIIEHQYLITGDLNDVIYSPSCEFKQPLQTIKGTNNYKSKVGSLWDQDKSNVELLEVKRDDETHVVATWRITGALRNFYLFGGGKLAPFTGRTRYTLDSESNKIIYSYEDWESTPWG